MTTSHTDSALRPGTPSETALRGRAVLAEGLCEDALVLIRGDRIAYAGPASQAPEHDIAAEQAHAGLILPGLVDIHDHGGGGASFPDCADASEAMLAVREHRLHGTTSLVASLVTASAQELRGRVAMLAELAEADEIAGIHLEGPFIAPERKGAQNPAHIQTGDAELVAELARIAHGHLVTMTLAPESADADQVIEALAAAGAVPSLGHTDASAQQMRQGIEESLRALARPDARSALPTATHLFNGMRPIHHRDPGPVMVCLDEAARGRMVLELIGDGVHLAPETLASVMHLVGPAQIALVTDAMAAAGMPDGRYSLGALDVTVSDSVATLSQGGAIAGGTAHLIDVVRVCVQQAGIDVASAVQSASATPARVLGMVDSIGVLAAGRLADVLLVDDDLRPVRVLRRGEPVD